MNVFAVAGQPCFPYLNRGSSQRTAACGTRTTASGISAASRRGQREWRVLSYRARCRAPDTGHSRQAGRLLPCNSSRACALSTRRALAFSSKSARRRRCRDSPKMFSATAAMSSRSSPTIPSSAISPRSTRRCVASTRRDSAAASLPVSQRSQRRSLVVSRCRLRL